MVFTVAGVACVVAGGLLAAATVSTPSARTTWATAYLVLVGGIAQAGLGLGQAMFSVHSSGRDVAVRAGGWNLGNVAVLAGTLGDVTVLVDLGGLLLVMTLGVVHHSLNLSATRSTDRSAGGAYTGTASLCSFSSLAFRSDWPWLEEGAESVQVGCVGFV